MDLSKPNTCFYRVYFWGFYEFGLPAFTSVFHCDAQGPGRLHVSSRSMHCFACFCTSRGFNSNSVSVCVPMKGLTPPSPPLPSMINETANAGNVIAAKFHAQCPSWPANNLICLRFINDSPASASLTRLASPYLCVRLCASVCVSRPSEDSTLTTLDALKARIRDLEKQLSKGDRFKCLICMVSMKAYQINRANTERSDNAVVMQKRMRLQPGSQVLGNKSVLPVMDFQRNINMTWYLYDAVFTHTCRDSCVCSFKNHIVQFECLFQALNL